MPIDLSDLLDGGGVNAPRPILAGCSKFSFLAPNQLPEPPCAKPLVRRVVAARRPPQLPKNRSANVGRQPAFAQSLTIETEFRILCWLSLGRRCGQGCTEIGTTIGVDPQRLARAAFHEAVPVGRSGVTVALRCGTVQ